jgi:hypothetical protein
MKSEQDPTLKQLQAFKNESERIRVSKDSRIAKNLKLVKGIFREGEKTISKVRGKQKTFFRKIWATTWRLTATMYQAYMKNPETFRVEGRDLDDDPRKAKVLQKVAEYRKDKLDNDNSLFLRLLWGIQAIFINGWVCGKIVWEYNEELGKDGPKPMIYPFEQVFPDLIAETEEEMRFIHFLNYMTDLDIEEMGLNAPAKAEMPASAPESNPIRDVRFASDTDPKTYDNASVSYSSPMGGTYPTPGSALDTEIDTITRRHRVYESFWKVKGKVMYALHIDFMHYLVKPKVSIYGNKFPIFTGQCLTEMHKLMGEGFPEPLEAPQESFNYNINMRKDNLAKAMTGHTFVSRFGGVDIDSLTHRRASGVTIVDDVGAVKHEDVPDVTQSSYIEADADEKMMDDMSGVNKTIDGQQDPEIKATTAQLNNDNSYAKIDLYMAIVGQTFFKGFTTELVRQIAMFETDEKILRIANERLRLEEETPDADEVYDIDIDIDCKINVGPGSVGQGLHVQQLLLAIDRGIQTMQSVPAIAQMGMIPREGLSVPNISALYKDLLPYIGIRNVKDYLITLPQPQMPVEAGAGDGTSTVNNDTRTTTRELVQQGSRGGV